MAIDTMAAFQLVKTEKIRRKQNLHIRIKDDSVSDIETSASIWNLINDTNYFVSHNYSIDGVEFIL